MDAADIPSVEALASDLQEIVVHGVERFSMEGLPSLSKLECLRSAAGHSANVLTVRKALIRHMVYLQPDWKRDSALALFGLAHETRASPLPQRRDAAGRLWKPPVVGNTFRGSDHGESRIVSELAAALHETEHNYLVSSPSEARPLSEQVRSLASIEAEQRLGYRWVGFRRVVSWDDATQTWHNEVSLTIEALRPDIRIIEYDYRGPRFTITGKPTVEPAFGGGSPSYLSSVPAGFVTHGYLRARFDVGRELLASERVVLRFCFFLQNLPGLTPLIPTFGVVPSFDNMELIELAFVPHHPERCLAGAVTTWHLGSIARRQSSIEILEDRLSDGGYAGVFTAPFVNPMAGVTHSLELYEMESVDVRELLVSSGVI